MGWFRDFTAIITILASLEFSYLVFATTTSVSPLAPTASVPPGNQGAVLSANAQALVNQTVSSLRSSGNQWDLLVAEALLTLVKFVQTNGWPNPSCTLDNIQVRREWGAFSKQERKDYIKAVLCLQKLPSKLNPQDYPGARTRYDDFVGVHINQTLSIHLTGNFLTWHRYFTWGYEQTLRDECGYKGYQPYYNWGRYAENPLASPVFDGSDTSISGDGAYSPHGVVLAGPPEEPIPLPPQNGGGCLFSGPFVNWTVNLGPAAPAYPNIKPNPLPNGLGYNPRCVIRDISSYVSKLWTNDSDIHDLVTRFTTIETFQNRLQGDFNIGYFGIHSGGHYTISGDPGGDFFASPGDPYFFLHHSAIDRLFWTWQNLNPQLRTNVIAGTITFNNTPPSRPATLQDPIDLGPVGTSGVLAIQNTVSTIGGSGSPFCYIYA